MRAAGIRLGGDRWLLLQSVRIEASQVEAAIQDILGRHRDSSVTQHLLLEEHRRLSALRTLKEHQLQMLMSSLIASAQEQASFSTRLCM